MVDVDKAVVAKLKTHGTSFEILVNCDNALKLKEGQEIELRDVLATEKIFSDAGKGMLASEIQMKSIFGTDDPGEIAKHIINKGEIQLTTPEASSIPPGISSLTVTDCPIRISDNCSPDT